MPTSPNGKIDYRVMEQMEDKKSDMRPVVVFDIDGTLTDYRKFIRKTAFPFFSKRYGLSPIYPDALEPEEIFDIKRQLMDEGICETDAEAKTRKMVTHFWIGSRFVRFSLLGRFRKHASSMIRFFKRKGFCVEIHTSRAMSTESSVIGWICRFFTLLQCRLNGVFISRKRMFFYEDDMAKTSSLIKRKPILVFDDKVEITGKLAEHNIHVVNFMGGGRGCLPFEKCCIY